MTEPDPKSGDTPANGDERAPDTERPIVHEATRLDFPTEPKLEAAAPLASGWAGDVEMTVNLTGDMAFPPARDDLAHAGGHEAPDDSFDEPANSAQRTDAPPSGGLESFARPHVRDGSLSFAASSDLGGALDHHESLVTQVYPTPGDGPDDPVAGEIARAHLKGLLEALIFVSDKPVKLGDLAKATSAPLRDVKDLLATLKEEYAPRGIQLDEVAGGWIFRTSAAYAPFVRDMTKVKPVKLSRAQIESLAILAYRQPITRPEIDDIRGVDSGPVLKVLLERDLIRILGKKDEPGRPLLYGTTTAFLEFFGLKSLRDLPTLREFTELNEDSRRVVEKELGEVLDATQPETTEAPAVPIDPSVYEDPDLDTGESHEPNDTLPPMPAVDAIDEPLDGDTDHGSSARSQMRAAAPSHHDADKGADALEDGDEDEDVEGEDEEDDEDDEDDEDETGDHEPEE